MNLSQLVEHHITRSPFILEAYSANLINTSALSRYLKPFIEKDLDEKITVGAINMAIKRLPLNSQIAMDKSISNFMSQLGDITVRSDLTEFTFRNSASLFQCQSEVINQVEDLRSFFYSFCKGVNETTIVCSTSLNPEVQRIFKNETSLLQRDHLAAVSTSLPPNNLDTYGVYYTILKRLAWNGINIIEVLSTSYEITLIVDRTDVETVFSNIIQLKNNK